jgi:hypothetical protein
MPSARLAKPSSKARPGEGWRLIRTHYDDGGLSGATMERPLLQRLMVDIAKRLIDAVVVYKVDRLTRVMATLLSPSRLKGYSRMAGRSGRSKPVAIVASKSHTRLQDDGCGR